jgi:hypothetical protein
MSYPVLEKLAAFLLDHPEYVHVDIEGHADARGDEDYNVDLSGRRARSILEFMVKRGMDEARLSSEGFGSSRPLVDGKDEHSLFMNRRVEFVVTRNRKVRLNPETGQEMGAAGKIEEAPAFGRDHDDLSAVSAESAAADSEAGTPDESAVDTSQSEPSDAPSPTEKRGSAP